ncbi:hypothetical protein FJZ17_02070 [Candidatus Pacearchaeota archaeon]|nr:hypothetical protein [Candidatus Pacearchaeota archaeon]
MADEVIEFIEVKGQRCVGGCSRLIKACAGQGFCVSTRIKHRIISQEGNDAGIEVLDESGKCPEGWISYNHSVNYRFVQQGSMVRAYIV